MNSEIVTKALRRLRPGAIFSVKPDGTLVGYEDPTAQDRPVPTTAEIDAELAKVWKIALKAHVNEVRARKENGPFLVDGHLVDADPKTQTKLTAKVTAIQAGLVSGDVAWRMADDVTYTIAQADFVDIAMGVSAKVEQVYAFSWALKAEIDAGVITTADEIEAAAWPM